MNTAYFENIERHCQECEKNNYDNVIIKPTRRCISSGGKEIDKIGVSQNPGNTLEQMINSSNQKYVKITEKNIYQIQNSKQKGITKYQTLGFTQAK